LVINIFKEMSNVKVGSQTARQLHFNIFYLAYFIILMVKRVKKSDTPIDKIGKGEYNFKVIKKWY